MIKTRLPRHIAIIMDGNGRWAKARGLPRVAGHRAGVESMRKIITAGNDLGIKVMSFYAFSSENWSRPKFEVKVLMGLIDRFLASQVKDMQRKNIRFLVIGEVDPVPPELIKKLRKAEEQTKKNTAMTVVVAINYGSRQEIVNAAKAWCGEVIEGKENINDLSPDVFNRYLYTAGLPDPDLLIRTSGEERISNFLLWQLSYAELYFEKVYWPDFGAEGLARAIEEFQNRERRFGGAN